MKQHRKTIPKGIDKDSDFIAIGKWPRWQAKVVLDLS
jgi:hypothetical protein